MNFAQRTSSNVNLRMEVYLPTLVCHIGCGLHTRGNNDILTAHLFLVPALFCAVANGNCSPQLIIHLGTKLTL